MPARKGYTRAAEIAVDLVRRGLLVPGTLDPEFHPWNLSTEAAPARLHAEAAAELQHSTLLGPGQICFFDITEKALREYPPTDAD
ncbi:hypothetical protein [Saccharopolyspora sp. 6V]|uniref:hypothetical protein n=1 Tax=Saccharopolyspora sp. 6V TaxID=2877239 RepID=UPI001CD34266|nr:hypothetical protein [Saccharopolyspora sp. 6V]MCA1194518.1 hypothetical protein [Saccharopolyspora sp. 6V]